MDSRDHTRLVSTDSSAMMAAQNLYGSGTGDIGRSMAINNSSGMRLPVTSMISAMQNTLDNQGTIYSRDSLQGMRPDGLFNMSEPAKKKRGRPRKYGSDGNMALALCHSSTKSDQSNNSLSESNAKRRGRPPGSGKKQQLEALGFSGTAFTPHVITIKAGEDVASKILAFSQQGSRTVCILSANGSICNVTLRQTATSGGTVSYEGRFEIISLSGSYLLTENDGTRSRTGGLSVSLAGPDGRVVGGGVAGMLTAATTVQVIVGSFIEKKKPKSEPLKLEPPPAPVQPQGFGAPLASSPLSHGSLNESDDEQRSPANHSSVGVSNNSAQQRFLGMPYSLGGWIHSGN